MNTTVYPSRREEVMPMSAELTYGELFAGYGGLGMGIQSVLGGEMSWCAEFAPAPSKILAHHWPDVPNLGDITKVEWASVPRVDVITGGSPCQDLSPAGKRAGMKAGTRSGLWASMRDAIEIIRPRLVVWENVKGALSAEADSEMEQCAGCVGGGDDGPVLRALGRVLGDLADIGYDANWYGLRAADVGAAHGRFRVFVFATPADADGQQPQGVRPLPRLRGRPDSRADVRLCVRGRTDGTPRDAAPREPNSASTLTLLPTQSCNDMGAGMTVDAWDAWTDAMQAKHGNGNGHGKSLSIEAARLLPTPRSQVRDVPYARDDYHHNLEEWVGHHVAGSLDQTTQTPGRDTGQSAGAEWGEYAAAIHRWGVFLGRVAPSPTTLGENGQPYLSAVFTEWLMGLPAGHVTDVPGISRNDQLKALGNGVVPQQAAAATRAFLTDLAREAVAS